MFLNRHILQKYPCNVLRFGLRNEFYQLPVHIPHEYYQLDMLKSFHHIPESV